MFWDKKEDKHLPDLPLLKQGLQGKNSFSPSLPQMHHEDQEEDTSPIEKHGLPSFPDSPLIKGFSQAAIKDAIIDDSVKDSETVGFPNEPKSFKVVEVEEGVPLMSPPKFSQITKALSSQASAKDFAQQMPSPNTSREEQVFVPSSSVSASRGEVFVKIDRFHSAKRALNTVQTQLESVDNLLKKIRETKMREEQEFSAWEKDMTQVRSKIEEITRNLFDKASD
ncbi:MAG: hypothetical protein AABY00_04040 [Nanoarchaeota archaeon]